MRYSKKFRTQSFFFCSKKKNFSWIFMIRELVSPFFERKRTEGLLMTDRRGTSRVKLTQYVKERLKMHIPLNLNKSLNLKPFFFQSKFQQKRFRRSRSSIFQARSIFNNGKKICKKQRNSPWSFGWRIFRRESLVIRYRARSRLTRRRCRYHALLKLLIKRWRRGHDTLDRRR